MANDTIHVPETLDFHSADTPRGMEFYNFGILTNDQQRELNNHKINTVRNNQNYLFHHPEIRAVLQIMIRKVLRSRPSHDVQSFIGKYFKENWEEIEAEVTAYATSLRGYAKPEKVKKVVDKTDYKEFLKEEHAKADSEIASSVTSAEIIGEPGESEEICREIVMEIVEQIGVAPDRVRRPKVTTLPEDIVPADEEIFAKLFGVSSTSLLSDDADDIELDLDFNAFHEDEDP